MKGLSHLTPGLCKVTKVISTQIPLAQKGHHHQGLSDYFSVTEIPCYSKIALTYKC